MNFGAWLPFTLVFVAVMLVTLWHMVTHDVPFMPKWAWALLVVVTFPIGSFIYIAVVMVGSSTARDDAEGGPVDR